ncbi:MAG: alpha/beta hydrolase [Gemmatimonadetes bacterium]|nr:alpha/beta hydrolase [Gemmatimonadota bacterium]
MEPSYVVGRARYRREMIALSGPKTPVGAVRDFEVPGGAGPVRVRHYASAGGGTKPLLVYYHGGGFVIGDLDTHDEPCRLLCRYADTHVLSVDYRLAPEHPFPAGVEDALAAFRWAREHAAALGADPARVAVGGDSAGGNLATVVSLLAREEGAPPVAQLLLYPTVDRATPRPSRTLFAETFFLDESDTEAFTRCYLGGTGASGDDPRVSPLRAPDLAGLPPALVVTAGFDVLRDEGEEYAGALQRAGSPARLHRVAGFGHGFIHLVGISPAARREVVRIARDWRALLDDARA